MSFSKIVGQERVIEVLRQILKNKRLPQVLLFYGPSGVGKRGVALELAKILNCKTQMDATPSPSPLPQGERADDTRTPNKTSEIKVRAGISIVDACDTCVSCRKIDRGAHPDVKIIFPPRETIGIDQIRALNWETQWRPFEGKYKVYILEKAEKLTAEAANSFLKTLEEPPANVLFILLSENKDTLLPTILSRCWGLPFSNLSGKMVSEILDRSFFPNWREILPFKVNFQGEPSENFFAGRIQEVIFSENFLSLYQKIEKFWQNIFFLSEMEALDLSKEYSEDKEKSKEFLSLLLLSARSKGYWQAVELINQTKNYLQRNLNRQLLLNYLLFRLRSLCR